MSYETLSSPDFRPYRRAVRKISRSLMKTQLGSFDNLAHSEEDYESILTARAWEAMRSWRSDPQKLCQGPAAEKKYVCWALWMEANRYERFRKRKKTRVSTVPLFANDLLDEVFEEGMALRHAFRRAASRLSARQWNAFESYIVNRGSCGNERNKQRAYRQARIFLTQKLGLEA